MRVIDITYQVITTIIKLFIPSKIFKCTTAFFPLK